MKVKYPYVPSPGYVTKTLSHFRKTLPAKVDASTLKKLGLAPKSETFIINLLRFLNIVTEEGSPTEQARKVFSQHDTNKFHKEFSLLVQSAYKELFDLYGDSAWQLDRSLLITFFREANNTSERVGTLQASTFLRLASMAGYGKPPKQNSQSNIRAKKDKASNSKSNSKSKSSTDSQGVAQGQFTNDSKEFCLTVRIEINLPSDGDQETYNRIFKSIREFLLNK